MRRRSKQIEHRRHFALRYEELIAEERLLSNEVQALNDKIDIWSSQKGGGQTRSESVPSARAVHKFEATNSNLLPEIVEYDVRQKKAPIECSFLSFLQKFLLEHGGLTGGWDDYDHGTFLRIRNKFKVERIREE